MENMLVINDLGVEFRNPGSIAVAVKGAGFEVKTGETVVLAGESGSGKTVTALAITRLLPQGAHIVSGSVTFQGKELLQISEDELRLIRGKEISYVFQEPASYLNPVFTVGSQISEVLALHQGLSGAGASAEVRRLLEAVKISDPGRVERSYPHQLSGGMNQRAFIAMALACRPKLLIADEPTTSLDVTIERQIIDLLTELKRSMGFSLLFITHNLAIARRIADRVVVMYQGQVVEQGDTAPIFASPRHFHTRELITAYEKIGRVQP
jgi:ABC-type dipeptide/oligopeptide/nickel transport system ATPase component